MTLYLIRDEFCHNMHLIFFRIQCCFPNLLLVVNVKIKRLTVLSVSSQIYSQTCMRERQNQFNLPYLVSLPKFTVRHARVNVKINKIYCIQCRFPNLLSVTQAWTLKSLRITVFSVAFQIYCQACTRERQNQYDLLCSLSLSKFIVRRARVNVKSNKNSMSPPKGIVRLARMDVEINICFFILKWRNLH